MQKCIREKQKEAHYKKNTLKSRIARVMRLSNTLSVIFLLIVMFFAISALVAIMGKGFTQYSANEIARDVQISYESLEDKSEFESMVISHIDEKESKVPSELLTEEELAKMREQWENFDAMKEAQQISARQGILADITYFEYQIHYDNQVIFDSYDHEGISNTVDDITMNNIIMDKVFTESSTPFFDDQGMPIGRVSVTVSPDMISLVYIVAFMLAIMMFAVNAVISKITTSIASKIVSRPLEALAVQMEDLAKDDIENAFEAVIDIKKPVSEVKSLIDSSALIMHKMAHYYELMMAQNEELEAQRDELESQKDELEAQTAELESQRDELESQNDQLIHTGNSLQSINNAYLNRTMKLQNLLDNMGQGFITFGKDLLINSEYSLACSSLLGEEGCKSELASETDAKRDITGTSVTALLFEDEEQREFIDELLVKILTGSEHERNLFLPLLPEEVEKNGSTQKIDYKIVKNEHFEEQMLVIMTDLTQTRELEALISAEHDILQMIVKVLLNREEFLSLIKEFNDFLAIDKDLWTETNYEEALRTIHTFKGSFSQYFMTSTSEYLNHLEDDIYSNGTIDGIKAIESELVIATLQKDLDIIEGYVGKEFIYNKDFYTIKEEKIIEIEQKIKSVLSASEFNRVIPIIQSIRYKSVKEALKSYPDYVTKLSERLGKSVLPFEITGDDVFVDVEIYQKVFKAMVHLFRNAVDHGIEDGDTRIENGKPISATIGCKVVDHGTTFDMIVSDDGRGIEGTMLEDIFKDGFTTKEKTTVISGRGVGLAALKALVEGLGGDINVVSNVGENTEFIISLPIFQGEDVISFRPERFIGHIEKVSKKYFNSMDFDLEEGVAQVSGQVKLHRVNALINMKGSVDGILIVSVNELFANDLVKGFMIEDIPEAERATYMEDVLGEVTNTILGNVLGQLEAEGLYLSMGIPVMLSNQSGYIKYSDKQIISVNYEKNGYIVSLSLLITEKDQMGGQIMTEGDIISLMNAKGGRCDG